MILPLVASMSEDALRAVPNELREGSLALGATKIETTFNVMIQASLSGIIASIILAFLVPWARPWPTWLSGPWPFTRPTCSYPLKP